MSDDGADELQTMFAISNRLFHLLQFNGAYQIQDPEEDRKNKASPPDTCCVLAAIAVVRHLGSTGQHRFQSVDNPPSSMGMGVWRSEELLLPVLATRTSMRLAVALGSTAFATTLYAQDFKDDEGDRLTIFPGATRFAMMFSIPLWSFALSCISVR
ncbi:hypothetical protein DEU56DRAFT_907884 [Suillus clintonianus]|uniref:uncharacterized protein n=1 Tax=Suillus clintonianus TaxID=1904413 RepID=UPI001B8811C5|nr:uncharacterized protein DEU56DRAFT_907884 [Suillus clintonianus]KAG2152709.1 hypothetical protein DEU56DRAFT_907884 [Suillus clintonianus]